MKAVLLCVLLLTSCASMQTAGKKPAYLIADITATDQKTYSLYQTKVPEIIAKYGGRYLVRGGKAVPFAGDWEPERILVLQFDSMEQLRKCFDSPEYRALAPLREKSTISQAIFVEGLSPDEISTR